MYVCLSVTMIEVRFVCLSGNMIEVIMYYVCLSVSMIEVIMCMYVCVRIVCV